MVAVADQVRAQTARHTAPRPPRRDDRGYRVAGGCSILAGLIHLAITPEHLQERLAVGVFFAVVAAFQFALGSRLLRRATPRLVRVGIAGTATLIVAWLVTRAVVLPAAPARRPEPVTLLGLVAVTAEVASIVVLARLLPPPRVRSRPTAAAVGGAAGALFVTVFLLTSGALSYVSAGGPAPSLRFNVPSDPSSISLIDSLSYPLVSGRLVPHVWLVGSLWSLVFAAAAGVFLAVGVTARLRLGAAGTTCLPARAAASAAPAFAAVSSCCGPSLALLLGTSAVPLLFRASPWILLVTAFLLAFDLRRLRATASPGPFPIPMHGGTWSERYDVDPVRRGGVDRNHWLHKGSGLHTTPGRCHRCRRGRISRPAPFPFLRRERQRSRRGGSA